MDLTKAPLGTIFHWFIFEQSKRDRDFLLSKLTGDSCVFNKQELIVFLNYLMSSKHIETLLDSKDDAYGNTPLHIAVSMYSDTVVSHLL